MYFFLFWINKIKHCLLRIRSFLAFLSSKIPYYFFGILSFISTSFCTQFTQLQGMSCTYRIVICCAIHYFSVHECREICVKSIYSQEHYKNSFYIVWRDNKSNSIPFHDLPEQQNGILPATDEKFLKSSFFICLSHNINTQKQNHQTNSIPK